MAFSAGLKPIYWTILLHTVKFCSILQVRIFLSRWTSLSMFELNFFLLNFTFKSCCCCCCHLFTWRWMDRRWINATASSWYYGHLFKHNWLLLLELTIRRMFVCVSYLWLFWCLKWKVIKPLTTNKNRNVTPKRKMCVNCIEKLHSLFEKHTKMC